jgi:hypothetical protein
VPALALILVVSIAVHPCVAESAVAWRTVACWLCTEALVLPRPSCKATAKVTGPAWAGLRDLGPREALRSGGAIGSHMSAAEQTMAYSRRGNLLTPNGGEETTSP